MADTSNLSDFQERLRSFEGWPVSFLAPTAMAAAGFYYTKHEDIVRAFCCGIMVNNWTENDDPLDGHLRWSPSCTFARHLTTGIVDGDMIGSCDFQERLRSFEGWSVPFLPPSTLAAAGFYYTKNRDAVRSFCCGIAIDNWTENNDPFSSHVRLSPGCWYARHQIRDICNRRPDVSREGGKENAFGIESLRIGTTLQALGVRKVKMDAFPEYANVTKRLESYTKKSWPRMMVNMTKLLCEAGFYYTGQGDRVICYQCGGGLQHWEKEDDPWIEHARYFPKCRFLHFIKGDAFVSEASKLHNANTATNEKDTVERSTTTNSSEPTSTETASPVSDNNRSTCVICCQEKNNILFLPCAHLISCGTCAASLISHDTKNVKCPLCRQAIKATVRVFY